MTSRTIDLSLLSHDGTVESVFVSVAILVKGHGSTPRMQLNRLADGILNYGLHVTHI